MKKYIVYFSLLFVAFATMPTVSFGAQNFGNKLFKGPGFHYLEDWVGETFCNKSYSNSPLYNFGCGLSRLIQCSQGFKPDIVNKQGPLYDAYLEFYSIFYTACHDDSKQLLYYSTDIKTDNYKLIEMVCAKGYTHPDSSVDFYQYKCIKNADDADDFEEEDDSDYVEAEENQIVSTDTSTHNHEKIEPLKSTTQAAQAPKASDVKVKTTPTPDTSKSRARAGKDGKPTGTRSANTKSGTSEEDINNAISDIKKCQRLWPSGTVPVGVECSVPKNLDSNEKITAEIAVLKEKCENKSAKHAGYENIKNFKMNRKQKVSSVVYTCDINECDTNYEVKGDECREKSSTSKTTKDDKNANKRSANAKTGTDDETISEEVKKVQNCNRSWGSPTAKPGSECSVNYNLIDNEKVAPEINKLIDTCRDRQGDKKGISDNITKFRVDPFHVGTSMVYKCLVETCKGDLVPDTTKTKCVDKTSYTSQKPFIEDGMIKQQFIVYKTLSGDTKTKNETEFTEWKKACDSFVGKNHVKTVKYSQHINETEDMNWYYCVATACDSDDFIPSGEWPVCSEKTKGNEQTAEQSGANDTNEAPTPTNDLEKEMAADIDQLTQVFNEIVKQLTEDCVKSGGKIVNGECVNQNNNNEQAKNKQ